MEPFPSSGRNLDLLCFRVSLSFTGCALFASPPQEWKACVCVLVQGAAWQFKGWEWDQPVTLFQNGELGIRVRAPF